MTTTCECGHERSVHTAIGCAICFNGPLPKHCLGFTAPAADLVKCPACGSRRVYPTEGNAVGNTMDCSVCGHDFTPDPPAAGERIIPASPDDMNEWEYEASENPHPNGIVQSARLLRVIAAYHALTARAVRAEADAKRLDYLWRSLPFEMRHRYGGDEREARQGIDAAMAAAPRPATP